MSISLGILILRLGLGIPLFGHGTQKLLGWFGGGGLRATSAGYDARGFRPGTLMALAAGLSEAGGAILLALGLATPVAVLLVVATMTVAISTHKATLWSHHGGFELPLFFALAALVIGIAGPGAYSIDGLAGLARWPLYAAPAATLLGVVGALVVIARSRVLTRGRQAGNS